LVAWWDTRRNEMTMKMKTTEILIEMRIYYGSRRYDTICTNQLNAVMRMDVAREVDMDVEGYGKKEERERERERE